MNSIELSELDALLADEPIPIQDEFTMQTLDVGHSTDMLLEELEDFELFESRMDMVNGDLLRFFDNPSIPTELQRMEMLDKLGQTLWYDKWVHERAAQFAELDDLDMALIEKGLTNEVQRIAKQRVHDIFDELKKMEVPKRDGLDVLADWAEENSSMLQAGDAAEYNSTFNVPEMSFNRPSAVSEFENLGVEMSEMVEQTINLSAPMAQLEEFNETEAFFGIDETTARFSQTAMDALDQVATTGGYGWDLWPTVEEMVGVGETVLSGAAGALVMYGLVEGLTPIIKSLGDTDWIRGGYSVETKESMSITDSITSSMLGPMYRVSQNLAKHLEDNPTYVWYLDNANARVRGKNSVHYILWDFIKDTPCSYYWLRGRVVAMEGTKVGYSDSKSKLLLGVKITKTITDMAPSTQTYWVNAESAVILRDGAAVQHAANTTNLTKFIFNGWDTFPLTTIAEITAEGNAEDQAMLNALLGATGGGDTGDKGDKGDKGDGDTTTVVKIKKDTYVDPIFNTGGGNGGDDGTGAAGFDTSGGNGGDDGTGAAGFDTSGGGGGDTGTDGVDGDDGTTTGGGDDGTTTGGGGDDGTTTGGGGGDGSSGGLEVHDKTVYTPDPDTHPFQQIKKHEADPVAPNIAKKTVDTLGFDQTRRRMPTLNLTALARVQTQDADTGFDTPPKQKKKMPKISPHFLKQTKPRTASRYTEFRPTRLFAVEEEDADYLPHIVVIGGLLIMFYFQN